MIEHPNQPKPQSVWERLTDIAGELHECSKLSTRLSSIITGRSSGSIETTAVIQETLESKSYDLLKVACTLRAELEEIGSSLTATFDAKEVSKLHQTNFSTR